MITCPSCEKPNEEASLHCGFCGQRLREVQGPKQTMLGMAVSDEVKRQYEALSAPVASGEEKPKATLLMGAATPELIASRRAGEVENPLLSSLPGSQKYQTLDGWPSPLKYTLEEITGSVAVPPRRMEETAPSPAVSEEALAETWELGREALPGAEEPVTIPPPEVDALVWGEEDTPASKESSEEALADTLEASRAQMKEAIASISPAAHARATVPAAAVAADMSLRGGAKTEVLLSDRSTDHVRRVERVAVAPVEEEVLAPRSFRVVQWALLGLLLTLLMGALVLGVVYFFFLQDPV
jgi:hypothetical protein